MRYQNDRFYDPIRREHRAVSFGLLSYSLPLDPDSSRAYRIVWDPLFFEFCQATGSHLSYDLETYRDLGCGSRRLFLLLKKIFWRRPVSPAFDVASLAVNTLGSSNRLGVNALKSKLKRCATELLTREIIALPDRANSIDAVFQKRRKGEYSVRFHRGSYFDKQELSPSRKSAIESPIDDPLCAIGFDARAIARISRQFNHGLIQVWADVTLAAIERRGEGFFRRSPQAFFMDNIKNAANGRRTPPDWFTNSKSKSSARTRRPHGNCERRCLAQRPALRSMRLMTAIGSDSNKSPTKCSYTSALLAKAKMTRHAMLSDLPANSREGEGRFLSHALKALSGFGSTSAKTLQYATLFVFADHLRIVLCGVNLRISLCDDSSTSSTAYITRERAVMPKKHDAGSTI